jgi:hypothetical protein
MNPNPLDVTWHWWVRFAQTSCVLLCAYVAAYYATVRPYPKNIFLWGTPPWHTYEIGGYRLPYVAHRFFRPIYAIDRKLRPETWWNQFDYTR